MSAFSIALTAQECTIETLPKTRVWKASPKGSEDGTAADPLGKEDNSRFTHDDKIKIYSKECGGKFSRSL